MYKSHMIFGGKLMKKILVMLISLALAASLASCSADGTEGSLDDSQFSADYAESAVSEVSEAEKEKVYVENIADFEVVTIEDGRLFIAKYSGNDPYVTVPAEYEGKAITGVLPETFDNCKFIRGIRVSEGIEEFGFIGEDSALEVKCTSIEEIALPSTLKWCGGFSRCKDLKEIILPESVTMLGIGNFCGCSSLERAIMPGVKNLQLDTFACCYKLSELVLADDYRSFGRNSLKDTAITELHLPDTFTVVAPGGFPKDCKLFVSEKLYADEAMNMVRDEAYCGISIVVELPEGSGVYYTERECDYSFLKNDDGEFYIDKYNGNDEYVIIPPKYLSDDIKEVSPDAFEGCDFIRGIKVGDILAENEEFMEDLHRVLPSAIIIK